MKRKFDGYGNTSVLTLKAKHLSTDCDNAQIRILHLAESWASHPAKRGSSMPVMPAFRQNKSPDWTCRSFSSLLSPRDAEVM